ncbi:hypothetical protein Godav_028929, partial [Gossypium davidsonii]|nr:hypothetical protein [Gossypium davidsonii]
EAHVFVAAVGVISDNDRRRVLEIWAIGRWKLQLIAQSFQVLKKEFRKDCHDTILGQNAKHNGERCLNTWGHREGAAVALALKTGKISLSFISVTGGAMLNSSVKDEVIWIHDKMGRFSVKRLLNPMLELALLLWEGHGDRSFVYDNVIVVVSLPPLVVSLKFNVDGAMNLLVGFGECGGVLSDNKRIMSALFSSTLQASDSHFCRTINH